MNTNKHSPTPWVADYAGTHGHIKTLGYREERGSTPTVARYDIDGVSIGVDEQKANAEFIIRAVNCHDDLVIALDDCVSVMTKELKGLAVIQPELRQALTVLAKATGEAP